MYYIMPRKCFPNYTRSKYAHSKLWVRHQTPWSLESWSRLMNLSELSFFFFSHLFEADSFLPWNPAGSPSFSARLGRTSETSNVMEKEPGSQPLQCEMAVMKLLRLYCTNQYNNCLLIQVDPINLISLESLRISRKDASKEIAGSELKNWNENGEKGLKGKIYYI